MYDDLRWTPEQPESAGTDRAAAVHVQDLLRGPVLTSKVKNGETQTLSVQLTNAGGTPAVPELKLILVSRFDPGR